MLGLRVRLLSRELLTPVSATSFTRTLQQDLDPCFSIIPPAPARLLRISSLGRPRSPLISSGVDLKAKLTEQGDDFLQINAKGSIPALVLDDGMVLTEGAVISQYLADLAPEAGLVPATGTLERYRTLEWLNFIATELHKGFGPLLRKDTSAELRAVVTTMLARKFDTIDRQLAGRDYLLADGFSIADAYAFTVLSWAPHVGIGLERWPSLIAYLERVSSRPSVRAAMAAEGLIATKAA